MTANQCMAIGVVAASLALAPTGAVGALETSPSSKAIRATCSDIADTYFLHVAVGASLENVNEYVDSIRDLVRPKPPRLVQALNAYDRSTSTRDYARALRRIVAWCTRTYGRL